ncbi:MAG: hypothetical protein ACLPV8_02770 [Steroidobacteraceae bacterium]
MNISNALKTLFGTAALTLPLVAFPYSTFTSGTGAQTASATVNFEVFIPQTLYLRVGTGSTYPGTLTTVMTTDLITFSPAVGTVGNSTPVAGVGGDLAGGIETAAVLSNGGNVTLVATSTAAGLTDGNGDFIPFTQITTTAATLTAGYTLLQAPTLNGTGGSTTVNLTASAAKIVQADAKWTFAYANTAVYPGGTYGGNGVNNSLVTYTATMP